MTNSQWECAFVNVILEYSGDYIKYRDNLMNQGHLAG